MIVGVAYPSATTVAPMTAQGGVEVTALDVLTITVTGGAGTRGVRTCRIGADAAAGVSAEIHTVTGMVPVAVSASPTDAGAGYLWIASIPVIDTLMDRA